MNDANTILEQLLTSETDGERAPLLQVAEP
jgi:hypothetical protein